MTGLSKKLLVVLAALAGLSASGTSAPESSIYDVDGFSGALGPSGLPQGWQDLKFRKIKAKTRYTLVSEGGNHFLKAESRRAASAIYKDAELDLKEYPVLSWKWKTENLLEKSDPKSKGGDDYPVRIYVAFKYDPGRAASLAEKAKYSSAKLIYGKYPPQGALNYVWDAKLPPGTAYDNPYSGKTKMIVVESGKDNLGTWVQYERNVYEDYKKLFGSEPPPVSFIAIMTDTDNTGESAVSYFDDIFFKKAP